MKIIFQILCISFVVLVMGCERSNSYDYLLKHPIVLQKELLRCQENDNANCGEVRRAGTDFSRGFSEMQDNQEQFGEKILLAQRTLQQESATIVALKKKLATSTNAKEKEKANNELEQLTKSYESHKAELKVMLAVVSATSPESL